MRHIFGKIKQEKCLFKSIFLLTIVLIITILISLMLGRYEITCADIKALFIPDDSVNLEMVHFILFKNRLPRILVAALVGAGLSVVGAALQGLFQNPLVSPDIIGVSAGSGFGAALGILISASVGVFTISLSFLFGLIGLLSTLVIVKARKKREIMSYVLGGIITTSVFSALTSLLKYIADPDDQLPAIVFWLMGSFANKSYHDVLLVFFPITAGITGIMLMRWRLNILSLGGEDVLSLGIKPKNTRILIILLSSVITASCVMVSGIIGWVGLIIPHIARQLFGVAHEKLLPTSIFLGAIFMLIVDTLARTLTAAEIPIGILTALIGAPFFAYVFIRMKGDMIKSYG